MANTFSLIQTTNITSNQASVTFSSIPQTFTDLQVIASVRCNETAIIADILVNCGNGTVETSNYSYREFTHGNNAVSQGNGSSGTKWNTIQTGSSADANGFSVNEIYFFNYRSSSNKTVLVNAGISESAIAGANQYRLQSWQLTLSSAINIITFSSFSSSLFVPYSTFSLYGISNA